MLEVKDAVRVSLNTFGELFPSESKEDLRLEEVFLSNDAQNWKVTVSYKNPDLDEEIKVKRKIQESSPNLFNPTPKIEVETRLYKSISIKANDGSFLEIKSA